MLSLGLASCIEDGVSTSSADQPSFSTDTLHMGTVFTDEVSATARLTVYNRASKGICISRIALTGSDAECFRLNVDGFSGKEFTDVEIRPNDSIFVMVSTTLPANGLLGPKRVVADLHFLTAGVDRSVPVAVDALDVERLRGVVVDDDLSLNADRPYVVFDSLVVAPGATLTLQPGTRLMFHQGAYLKVDGTLHSLGTVGREVTLSGDRTGNVAANISFDIMSRQWDGIYFTSSSRDNRLEFTHVCNTTNGVAVNGSEATDNNVPTLTLINSRLRNSGGNGLSMIHANLHAYGSEIAESAGATLLLWGGDHIVDHCTLSNYYLFAAPSAPILTLGHLKADSADPEDENFPFTRASISNSIIYGMNADVSHGDLAGTGVVLNRCLLKSAGSDDDNFVDCLWDQDPLFHTVRSDYYFDYRVKEDSPARGAGNYDLTPAESAIDRFGTARPPSSTLGAYEYVPDEQ